MGESRLERAVSWPQGKLAPTLVNAASELSCQLVKAQQSRDDKIATLIQTLQSTYSIVVGSEILKDERLQDVLSRILKQTVDCGFFIQEYTRHGTFLGA